MNDGGENTNVEYSEQDKDRFVKLFIHWDTNYWYSVYIFLLIMGMLVVAYTQILINSEDIINEPKYLDLISFCGLGISIVWLFVLNRKFTVMKGVLEVMESNVKKDIDNKINERAKNPKYLSFFKSHWLVNYLLPVIFICFWIIMFARY